MTNNHQFGTGDDSNTLIASDKVEGTAVYSSDGDRLGTIENFMVDKRSGEAAYAILTFGGFLGIGEDRYPVPWSKLRYDVELEGYVVDISREQLEHAPRYATNEEPAYDRDYQSDIYGAYGLAHP